MKIYSWNVNGLRAAMRKGFLQWFKRAKPDIVCLQEIKAQSDTIPEEISQIKDYHLYLSPAEKKGYAGTAALSKKPAISVKKKIGKPKFDQEGRFLFLEYDDFYLFNTYFPHSRRDLERLDFKQEFNQAYLNFVKKKKNKPLILTGDFNVAHQPIDLARPQQNKKNAGFTAEERAFADELINKHGWKDTFRELHPRSEKYTWWSYRFNARERNVGWRVDYFLVKDKKLFKKVKKAQVHDKVEGSDHCPISLELAD